MGIGLQSLSESLWGIKSAGLGAGELVIDESDLRGWINGRDPIPTHRLRVAVLKAWACGWMTSSQAVSAISTISDREVAGSVARQFLKRLRSGKALGTPESLASWVEAEREAQERAAMEGQTKVLDLTDGVLNIAALSGAQAKLLQICSTEGAKSC